jgi:hypothetical protein
MCLRTRRDDHFSGDSSNSHYLAAFNYFPTVAFWLPAGNAALLALIKDDTSFERCMGGSGIRSAVGAVVGLCSRWEVGSLLQRACRAMGLGDCTVGT